MSGLAGSLAVRLGEDDQVTIEVANPDLAVPRVGIEMDVVHEARADGADALDRLADRLHSLALVAAESGVVPTSPTSIGSPWHFVPG